MSSNPSGSSHKKANYVDALVAAWLTPGGFRFSLAFWLLAHEMKSAESGNRLPKMFAIQQGWQATK